MPDTDTSLHDIESKISYQELLLEKLNEALTSQQQQIDALCKQIDRLTSLIREPQPGIRRPEEENPPPHY